MGHFNNPAYRKSRQQTKSLGCWVWFWVGVVMLIMSGGKSFPLSALFMFPSSMEMLQRKLDG
jgi:hypothetical protein